MSHCLHSACVGGHVSVFTRLLETEDPNIVDEEGLSLLHSAVVTQVNLVDSLKTEYRMAVRQLWETLMGHELVLVNR